jgi:hypothetical protein
LIRRSAAVAISDKPAPTRNLATRFYTEALDAAEQTDLDEARSIDGVDEEIALLRLRLRQALTDRPDDLALIFRGVELLAKLVATRYRLSKRAERELGDSIANVVRTLGDLWPEGDSDG